MTESKEEPTVPQGEHPPQTIAGMYLILNMATRNMLDLSGNNRDDGTAIISYPYVPWYGPTSSQWDIRNCSETMYIVRNIRGGIVLSLVPNADNVLVATGTRPQEGSRTQHWILKEECEGFYSLENAASPQVLEVKNGSMEHATPIVGADYQAAKESQLWHLERRDRSIDDVKSIIEESSILKGLTLGWPSGNVRFLTLPPHLRNELYHDSKIGQRKLGFGTSEPKDLALRFKDTVWAWAVQNVGIKEYSFLFGVVCGSTAKGPKVYNWQLSQDLCDVVFIDPLSAREYTSKSLQREGFQSEWGTC